MNAMDKKSKRAQIFLFVLLLVTSASVGSAQTPVPQPETGAKPAASPSAAAIQQTQAPEEPLVYGLQGVLIQTVDGKNVAAKNIDQTFNPASSVKLGLALVALHTFGPQYRFTTGFWTDGTINKTTGELIGNLYVTGRDPSFHYEHAIMIARLLNNVGIRTVTGNIVVAPGFTMNFSASARRSGEMLHDTLD